MLIVFYVLLVWLKVVLGISVCFLWLWFVRDRGFRGLTAGVNYLGVFVIWALPWALFLYSQAQLYQGHCGLRQGVHDCDLFEFLWTRLHWLRLGFLLDLSLVIGVALIISRSRPSLGEDSRFFGPKGPRPAAS